MTTFAEQFFKESIEILKTIPTETIEKMAKELAKIRENEGRLFFLGVGGSAGNCSHAVNDFRKICGFEAYAPTDNVSELTARTNDDGWDSVFSNWLKTSKLSDKDGLFIFSVGGGNLEKNVSPNLVKAIDLAKTVGAKVFGVVGKDGGYTAKSSDLVVVIPVTNPTHTTPHTEAFHSVVWHLLVSHPTLKLNQTKWESVV
ncbi:MAG: SIS domain-containing protein [Leptospiraceae bacterium]|nr:SIS domain-containing protein [Leptospiraceae bacterium]